MPRLRHNDVLMITADHGCDPGDSSTDHTREGVPLIIVGDGVGDLGTINGFGYVAQRIKSILYDEKAEE